MWNAGKKNFSFNSTFNVTEDDLSDYGLSIYNYPGRFLATKSEEAFLITNQIWARFIADPDFSGQPVFNARLGLRYYNLTAEDETDENNADSDDQPTQSELDELEQLVTITRSTALASD